MEEVVEGLFRGVARLIKWIIIDILIQFCVYGYGYVTLKIVTVGIYPKENRDNESLCVLSGIISVAVIIGLIANLN